MSKEKKEPNPLNRRTMLLATGGAVAVGMLPIGSASAARTSREILLWSELVGTRFEASLTGPSRFRGSAFPLQLVEVREPTFKDPDRPGDFRQPFSLIFMPLTSGEIPSGQYTISNRRFGRQTLFLNDVMDMETGAFVVEAVFG